MISKGGSIRLFIGDDPLETRATECALKSLHRTSRLDAELLQLDRLRATGLLRRPMDARGGLYDFGSQAACATEFAISRFLVPIICQRGWALFTDCDVVFCKNVVSEIAGELNDQLDDALAVYVVKHDHAGHEGHKMLGQVQQSYPRKNWSSVMLFNCDHPAHRRLSLDAVNNLPGRDLHAFCWLHDSEIGELPNRFNWLVNVHEKPADPVIAHFTLGGPWLDNWAPQPYDEIWSQAWSAR